jgi:hypothetical protein
MSNICMYMFIKSVWGADGKRKGQQHCPYPCFPGQTERILQENDHKDTSSLRKQKRLCSGSTRWQTTDDMLNETWGPFHKLHLNANTTCLETVSSLRATEEHQVTMKERKKKDTDYWSCRRQSWCSLFYESMWWFAMQRQVLEWAELLCKILFSNTFAVTLKEPMCDYTLDGLRVLSAEIWILHFS